MVSSLLIEGVSEEEVVMILRDPRRQVIAANGVEKGKGQRKGH